MGESAKEQRLSICRDSFVRSLLEGRREEMEEDLCIRRRILKLDKLCPPFVVAEIAPDYTQLSNDIKDEMIYEVYEACWKFLGNYKYEAYCVINGGNNVQVILSLHEKLQSSAEIEKLFQRLYGRLSSQYALDLFIGIGNVVDSLMKISNSASEAREMLGYKYQYADHGVINIANIVRFRYNSSMNCNIAFERVLGCFQDGNLGKMSRRLDELVEQIRYYPHVSSTSIRRTMIELAVRILNVASNANVDVDEVLGGRDPYWWILQQNHTEVITEWIMQISSELWSKMHNNQMNQERETIHIAREYIKNHLEQIDLGLQKVSEVVGLSAPYFSQLFKHDTGTGINMYIVTQRIDKAKFLLRTTKLKNLEIAQQVGFSSAGYFCQAFKKHVGLAAREYRRHYYGKTIEK